MDENHPIENEDVYGLSKQCNELTAAMYTRRTGMATTCFRLTWVTDLEKLDRWSRRWLERAGENKSPDMWSYVDRRDVASAFRLAIEKVESGHHILLLAARDLWGMSGDSAEGWRARIEEHYPNLVSFLDNGFDYGKYGFLDTRRAGELLGWESRFHWREALGQ
jgi:nucleoside-diphosphate-sugar epimerase